MSGSGASSAASMVDAQYTSVRVLRPFSGFEQTYQGRATTVPIAFPGTRDPRAAAGKPGFSPQYMAGYAVPFGARVVLGFPVCMTDLGPVLYTYQLIWRLSGPDTAIESRPRHFQRQRQGAPDSSSGSVVQRFAAPALWHAIGYEQGEPLSGPGLLNLRMETVTPIIQLGSPPLLQDGSFGAIEQGVYDPAAFGPGSSVPLMPTYMPFWTDAAGDELIILASRAAASSDVAWDFSDPAADRPFSDIYGTGAGSHPERPSIGITMQTGTSP